MKAKIEKIIEKLPESGYRSVTDFLKNEMAINKKKVQRIMQKYDLQCKKRAKFKCKTTDSDHKLQKYPDLFENRADAENLAKLSITDFIVGDVTAFNIKGKDHFLALLMKLSSRKIVGAAVSDKNDTELVSSAFLVAKNSEGSFENFVHHTDSDVRYCSEHYVNLIKNSDLQISMCKGNAYKNPHAESLNKTLKRQEINISDYENKEEAANSIFEFINKYNSIRPHSALGGLSPLQFEKKLQK